MRWIGNVDRFLSHNVDGGVGSARRGGSDLAVCRRAAPPSDNWIVCPAANRTIRVRVPAAVHPAAPIDSAITLAQVVDTVSGRTGYPNPTEKTNGASKRRPRLSSR